VIPPSQIENDVVDVKIIAHLRTTRNTTWRTKTPRQLERFMKLKPSESSIFRRKWSDISDGAESTHGALISHRGDPTDS
jgi:hypothetical protein